MPNSEHQAVSNAGSFQEQTGQNIHAAYPVSWSQVPIGQSSHRLTSGPEGLTQSWYAEPSTLMRVKEDESHFQTYQPQYYAHQPFQAGPG